MPHLIDAITEDLFQVLPIIHKKLLRIDLELAGSGLSRLHVAIMGILSKQSLTISAIGCRLFIPRPQMTRLIKSLSQMGFIAWSQDETDRRTKNIVLTEAGVQTLKHCKKLVRDNIKHKLSHLTQAELQELADSLAKIRQIGTRFS